MNEEDQLSSASEYEDDNLKALRIQRHARREAITKSWGYNLYKEIVEFPSDVLSFLRSNILPPYSVIKSAQAFREEPASQVQRIDARLLAIEQEIEALKKENDALREGSKAYRTKLRGYDAVLAPFRRLPFDIICEIARHTLPPHPSPCINQSPLNISQTSSVWRAAAQFLPQLWSTVYIMIHMENSWRKARRQVSEFSINAKKQPLSLFLFFDGARNEPLSSMAKKMLGRFLQSIGPSMPQVERLGIGAYNLADIWNNLDLASSSWNLESLKYLHTLSQDIFTASEGDTLLPAAAFRNTPALTRMSAFGPFFTCAALGSQLLDSSSLRELNLREDLSAGGWADLLDLCPRLEIGQFHIQTCDDSQPRPFAQTHEAIRDLSLYILYETASITTILSQFRMPALKILRISTEDDDDPIPSATSTFHSYANVRHLSIAVIYEQRFADIHHILNETVNLEERVLTSCPLTFGTIFDAMVFEFATLNSTGPTTARRNMLPRLSTIRVEAESRLWTRDKLKVMNETILYVDALARMLNSRRPSQIPSGCQAMRKAIIQLYHTDGSSSGTSVAEELLNKTSHCQTEGLVLRCLNSRSDDVLDWEHDPPSHPFDEWLAPDAHETRT
ncbi:hypothetical protein CPB83DRAFT_843390 [Crepidotus variabilis]|uniref:F-box domain-containing protein n=1 Tax=Crepidotus variabilis TaxID=179855 RepID=A0A9P6ETE6_9AGAR|nr:hypothetical protein CPB83DRAFT_843390 [Crepidotus variabilis]